MAHENRPNSKKEQVAHENRLVFKFQKGKVSYENRPFYENDRLFVKIDQFLNLIKVQIAYENSQVFEFQNGQVAYENRTVSVCVGKLPVKIDQFLNFKNGRSPMII